MPRYIIYTIIIVILMFALFISDGYVLEIAIPFVIWMCMVMIHKLYARITFKKTERNKMYREIEGEIIDCDIKTFTRAVWDTRRITSVATFKMIMTVSNSNNEYKVIVASDSNCKDYVNNKEWKKKKWIGRKVKWNVSYTNKDPYYVIEGQP